MSHNRGGFALIMALVVLVFAGALMLAALYATSSDSALAAAESLRGHAIAGAERALVSAAMGDAATIRARPVGVPFASSTTTGETTAWISENRVDTSIVWIVVVATAGRGDTYARHRLGVSLLLSRDTADHRLRPVPGRAWAELF